MALKIYRIGSLTFQYEEGNQPAGAVEVVKPEPKPKAKPAADKAARTQNK